MEGMSLVDTLTTVSTGGLMGLWSPVGTLSTLSILMVMAGTVDGGRSCQELSQVILSLGQFGLQADLLRVWSTVLVKG